MLIRGLSLAVHLGCTAEERAVAQEVRVNVALRFVEAPHGCVSDDLRDTVCYARVSNAIKEHVVGREFQLVEKMAADFYGIVGAIVEGRAAVSLTVHKVRPPVEGLVGGVEYTMGNFV